MASRLFIPARMATMVRERTAVRGWTRPLRERGSGTEARTSTKDDRAIAIPSKNPERSRERLYPSSQSSPTSKRKQPCWRHYKTFVKKSDLYCSFVEKSLSLLRSGGRFAYIVSNG